MLFRLSFGFLLGRCGVCLLSVRRRGDLSVLDRVQFPQHGLQLVFLLLKVQLHTGKTKQSTQLAISCAKISPGAAKFGNILPGE